MRPKASKRSLSTAPTSAESDDDGRSKKKVRWESRSDNEGTGTVTASGDFYGTGEEGNATPDSEKVHLFLQRRAAFQTSRLLPVDRSVLQLAVKGENSIYIGVDARIEAIQWLPWRRVF